MKLLEAWKKWMLENWQWLAVVVKRGAASEGGYGGDWRFLTLVLGDGGVVTSNQ